MAYRAVLIMVIITLVQMLHSPAADAAGGDPAARAAHGPSPHNENGTCSICHVAPADTLRSWFAFGSTKRALVADPTTLCRTCHGVSFGHGIGKRPALNRDSLPLNNDGTINCALTCHDMHISGTDDPLQQRNHLRLQQDRLCFSCHNR